MKTPNIITDTSYFGLNLRYHVSSTSRVCTRIQQPLKNKTFQTCLTINMTAKTHGLEGCDAYHCHDIKNIRKKLNSVHVESRYEGSV